MTTKKKFEVENPEVIVLRNGRYAYKAECPWEGKNGKKLIAFKFCSAKNHQEYEAKKASTAAIQPTPELEPPEIELRCAGVRAWRRERCCS